MHGYGYGYGYGTSMGMCVCSYVHMYIGQIGGVTYGEMGVRDFTSRFELNQRIARDRASSWGVGGGVRGGG